jgi:succinylglutamate desuccinylase
MDDCLFRQSFLIDSLYGDSTESATSFVAANGTQFIRHFDGILEVVPAAAKLAENPQHIIISCGVHGNETAPIELVNGIVTDLESGKLEVAHRCLFIIANIEAIKQNQRFIDENMNRLFDDVPRDSTKELVLADNLKIIVQGFWKGTPEDARWHLDLHCAIRASKHYTFAISPKSRYPVRDKQLFDLMEAAQLEAVVLSNAPSCTFSWYTAASFQAKALTVELGKVARLGQNDLTKLAPFDGALRTFIAGQSLGEPEHKADIYRVSRTITRINEDFAFLFDDDVANFTSFVHGEVFGHDGDKPLMAKNDDEAILFPNTKVAVGERAALMVCKVAARYEQDQLVYD